MSLTDLLGDAILNTAALNEFSTNYSLTIPSEYDSSNLKIVAIVVNQDNIVINTQFAYINENKTFE